MRGCPGAICALAHKRPDPGVPGQCADESAATAPGSEFFRRLAWGASPEQVDDREKHCRTQERHEQARDAEVVGVDRACAEQRRDQEAGDKRADDAHDDVEKDALLAVGPHDEAREPSQDTPYHQPNDDVHVCLHSMRCDGCRRTGRRQRLLAIALRLPFAVACCLFAVAV